MDEFRALPDLAARDFGGSVVWANDESFAERHNLILPGPARFDPAEFGHRGKVYDGWETRRRREPGNDAAIVRLGTPGVVHGVVVDTSWFKGNYPPEVSVEAASVPGYPSVAELQDAEWQPIIARAAIRGDTENALSVSSRSRWTHVRLSIYPDGGVARFRVHGEAVPDPALSAAGLVDLAAAERGGRVVGCSDMFYGSPGNLIGPGRPRDMRDGWETARRRDNGNDWVVVALGAEGRIRLAELDTSCFLHNAPGWAMLRGRVSASAEWLELLPRTRLQPDTRHRFVLADPAPVTEVRLDVYPDGGMARLRLFGVSRSSGE
ncbi:MAG: allantoicase [Pseudonocardiales bacterium]|nr:allantoicase [Pseudonocardiales bacterium]